MPHGRPAKRRRLTPPPDDRVISETIKSSDLFTRAVDWDLEQDYEQKLRNRKKKQHTKLPIKNAEGIVEHVKEVQVSADDSDSFLGSGDDEEGENDDGETPPTEEVEEAPAVPLQIQIRAAKEELARTATLLNEDPEEHVSSFRKLAEVGDSAKHPAILKLALATQAAVYKDVIPGYRIRAYQDEDLGTKISKEVRRTRQYEQALVTGYQAYVKQLSSIAKHKSEEPEENSLRAVAFNCACTLLLAVPHFNCRTELLNILVLELSGRRVTPEFKKCIETLERFFAADDDGAPSLEAVSLLTKMMKAKDYRIREEVLNVFFHLRLLSELSSRGSTTTTEKAIHLSQVHGKKVKKEKWEHRSKKDRKLARERKAVEKDMKDADATLNYEEREKMQSETLKLVFVTYFRILKARSPELMGAVLEGLAKYAHMINQDFFGDILEALKDIVGQAEAGIDVSPLEDGEDVIDEDAPNQIQNRRRETLLATQTAFTLLSSQDVSKSAAALHLDLSFFTQQIYRSLYPLALDPDIELGPKSLHLPDPHASSHMPNPQNKVNISTPVLLLTRVLTSILLTPAQPPPSVTAASFYKRLLTAILHLPEKSTLAILSLLHKIAEKHGRKIESLWYSDERKGDGIFRGEAESVEGTNVLSVGSGVWENELLRHHYCPKVRQQVTAVDKIISSLHR